MVASSVVLEGTLRISANRPQGQSHVTDLNIQK
jgi:hypothetical protein